jgi:DNA (cytosine-5)-methyltransferase 1
MKTISLFSGIGGFEVGLTRAGHSIELSCEIDEGAKAVLEHHFDVPVRPDVRKLKGFPSADLIAAGFPCQDLSQAGRTVGIRGRNSRLVEEIFKRIPRRGSTPRWLLLENVPFMLQLQGGRAMRYLVTELESLGFMWAYRVVDTRAFGLPQRRLRVILLASRTEDPRPVLFGQDGTASLPQFSSDRLCGFYWTEGLRGLGWAVDAVPTLKGGSTIGIPSPPAIWDPTDGSITVPDLRDAERLQGFDAAWTAPAVNAEGVRDRHRWKLVGNALSVPVAEWIGRRLIDPTGDFESGRALTRSSSWPRAAWGYRKDAREVDVSPFPVQESLPSLRSFLKYPRVRLSHRAALGFLNRALLSSLRFEDGFLIDIKRHVEQMARIVAA